ncbi:putative ATPase (AAA+ superfamily) [Marinitoga piezophila KA3]|uniref:Putative ATPase (AAA+ superfamily) n=1 Tax=Marinitoga piezophila (strain DSM 14283 / JCM 11233 / KA3) TaxID=443254 RepID=H2J843_MARPK|nr:AAA family ATPase [Marinitoga piezophila]AEX85534.1 putative ATPase (AAA+ superfamily) [Marinitoga piezophila KA3]
MEIEDVIEQLELKKERLLNALPEKKRLYFQKIEKYDDTRGMLLYGPRGVGKTTYLLMKAAENNFFYLSGDDPKVAAIPLFDLGEKVFLQGYNGIIIDEVHYLNKWSIHIKALYDSYPDKKIWISDSSSIILRTGIADLSRRFVKVRIPLLSFREYIHFLTNKEIMEIENPFNIEKDRFMNQIRDMDILKLFKDYASSGTRPFFLENNYVEKMENILEKTLYSDIPFFLNTIKENHLKLMKAIIGYLIYSKIPTINVERMGKEWQLSKNKLYELLNVMEEAELINIVLKEKDFKINSKGEKIFLADPSYYYIYNGEIGKFREAFTVFALKEKGKIFSSKNEQDGDFVWNGIKIEVGGKNKKIKNSDFVIRDDIDLPLKNKIPLWLLGFLW